MISEEHGDSCVQARMCAFSPVASTRWRIGVLVLGFLVLFLGVAEAATLRGAKDNPLSRASDAANKMLDDSAKEVEDRVAKPVMGGISKFRLLMCLGRPNLLEHKKCLKFFEKKCPHKTTTEGTCQKFLTRLDDECNQGKQAACDQLARMEDLYNEGDEGGDAQEIAEPEEQSTVESNDYGTEELATGGGGDGEDYEGSGDDFPDADNDGVRDSEDAFPNDPNEHKDTDGDGTGDSSDPHPTDPTRWGQWDPNAAVKDSDGDGVPDDADAFPNDKNKYRASDGDGVGDKAESDGKSDSKDGKDGKSKEDTDGDGVPDADEVYPNDPKRTILKGSKVDSDGDGVFDNEDAFPHNDKETKDSDGDGTGDNSDTYPNDPACSHAGGFNACGGNGTDADSGNSTNSTGPIKYLDKKITPMHEDGYNEYTKGKILHEDIKTRTGDWLKERPRKDESDEEATVRHCQKTPHTVFCTLYLRKYGR